MDPGFVFSLNKVSYFRGIKCSKRYKDRGVGEKYLEASDWSVVIKEKKNRNQGLFATEGLKFNKKMLTFQKYTTLLNCQCIVLSVNFYFI